ncbi:MAG: hypothetical protein MR766_01380 [Erysipelotrichaceae bacterium]|nr:hypothetical protein [Erysipelotrichaceae bacterium]
MMNLVCAYGIDSSAVKLVVGYEYEKEVIVLFSGKKDLAQNVILNDKVNDSDAICMAIKDLLLEAENSLKMDITSVTLVLPANGLEVFENVASTSVVSTSTKIADVDIRNVINMLLRDNYSEDNEVVDIIPITYSLDKDRVFSNPPLGEESTTLTLKAFVHTVPRYIKNVYMSLIEKVGLKVNNLVVAPYGIGQLFLTYKDVPNKYFLVNLGANNTSVVSMSNGKPYRVCFVNYGSDSITKVLANRLGISYEKAEELKRTYGLEKTTHTYLPNVVKSELSEDIKFTAKEIAVIISDELERLMKDIIRALKTMSSESPELEQWPVVFVGGGRNIIGFKDFVKEKIQMRKCILPAIKSIGARNMIYIDELGAIKIVSNVTFKEDKHEAGSHHVLTRETEVKTKYSETKDSL